MLSAHVPVQVSLRLVLIDGLYFMADCQMVLIPRPPYLR